MDTCIYVAKSLHWTPETNITLLIGYIPTQNKKFFKSLQVWEGEGGMFQENSIETCILSRVKQITSPGWMHETSARAWGGRGDRDGEYMYIHGWFMSVYDKNHYNIVK